MKQDDHYKRSTNLSARTDMVSTGAVNALPSGTGGSIPS